AEGEKLTWLTAYDYPTATFEEAAGIDMILVGDSMGNCVYGYQSGTLPVTMDMCIVHCQAIRRGAPNTHIMGDMPFGSYQTNPEDAVRNAVRFYKEAEVDSIKLEGGRRIVPMIKAIVDAGMVLCGHIGLTPQSTGQFGGYKAQGRTAEAALEVIKDARAVRDAGAAMLLLEAVTPEVGAFITKDLDIPVYSIGAGIDCDGQLLIVSDVLGIWEAFKPKFVKRYAEIADLSVKALTEYVDDVRTGKFPEDIHCYKMIEGEAEKLEKMAREL
ncbi:MAG: 3-methyl-2-oxobutanoate hydroxymethyltransferase, partial [Dehalococcoidia bacterium]|nr:3-methyl-2-oxobutanoate hydroxymethyltransferase [Dehalococcoidia bacterium]